LIKLQKKKKKTKKENNNKKKKGERGGGGGGGGGYTLISMNTHTHTHSPYITSFTHYAIGQGSTTHLNPNESFRACSDSGMVRTPPSISQDKGRGVPVPAKIKLDQSYPIISQIPKC